jgi:hypothetical protein
MFESDCYRAKLGNRLLLVRKKDHRWFGEVEFLNSNGSYRSESSPDTETLQGAQNFLLRHVGYDAKEAEPPLWRPCVQVISFKRLSRPTMTKCEQKDCPLPIEYAVEFLDTEVKPDGWPSKRFFCKDHGKSFAQERRIPVTGSTR